ncbi:MAG: hypothetical protein ACO4AI_15825, partial [Prochlorothrix sp.]
MLLVWDDFERNLTERPGTAGETTYRPQPEAGRLLAAVVWAIEQANQEGAAHRLLINCRYDLPQGLPGMGRGWFRQGMEGMREADLRKKCDRLGLLKAGSGLEPGLRNRILGLADGNPRLLEWLDKLAQESQVRPQELDLELILQDLGRNPPATAPSPVLHPTAPAQTPLHPAVPQTPHPPNAPPNPTP